jgi:hypothetical protein
MLAGVLAANCSTRRWDRDGWESSKIGGIALAIVVAIRSTFLGTTNARLISTCNCSHTARLVVIRSGHGDINLEVVMLSFRV